MAHRGHAAGRAAAADLPACPGLRLAARYRPQSAETRRLQSAATSTTSCRGCGRVLVSWWPTSAARAPHAAALTALIRHTVRAEIDHGLGPAVALERLNRAMLRASGGRPGRFATVAHARITRTPSGATVRLASAGHPPPLLRPRRPDRSRVGAGHPARRLPGRRA